MLTFEKIPQKWTDPADILHTSFFKKDLSIDATFSPIHLVEHHQKYDNSLHLFNGTV